MSMPKVSAKEVLRWYAPRSNRLRLAERRAAVGRMLIKGNPVARPIASCRRKYSLLSRSVHP